MTKIICNVCGNELDEMDISNFKGLHQRAGYGSKYDGDKISLDLCCSCFDKFIETVRPMCKYDFIEEYE